MMEVVQGSEIRPMHTERSVPAHWMHFADSHKLDTIMEENFPIMTNMEGEQLAFGQNMAILSPSSSSVASSRVVSALWLYLGISWGPRRAELHQKSRRQIIVSARTQPFFSPSHLSTSARQRPPDRLAFCIIRGHGVLARSLLLLAPRGLGRRAGVGKIRCRPRHIALGPEPGGARR